MAGRRAARSFKELYRQSNFSLPNLSQRRLEGRIVPRVEIEGAEEGMGVQLNRSAIVDLGFKGIASLRSHADFARTACETGETRGVFKIENEELNPMTAEVGVREEELMTDDPMVRVGLATAGFQEVSMSKAKQDVLSHILFEGVLPAGFASSVVAEDGGGGGESGGDGDGAAAATAAAAAAFAATGKAVVPGRVLNTVAGGFAIGLGGVVAFLPSTPALTEAMMAAARESIMSAEDEDGQEVAVGMDAVRQGEEALLGLLLPFEITQCQVSLPLGVQVFEEPAPGAADIAAAYDEPPPVRASDPAVRAALESPVCGMPSRLVDVLVHSDTALAALPGRRSLPLSLQRCAAGTKAQNRWAKLDLVDVFAAIFQGVEGGHGSATVAVVEEEGQKEGQKEGQEEGDGGAVAKCVLRSGDTTLPADDLFDLFRWCAHSAELFSPTAPTGLSSASKASSRFKQRETPDFRRHGRGQRRGRPVVSEGKYGDNLRIVVGLSQERS